MAKTKKEEQEYMRDWRAKNPDKRPKEYFKNYYKDNKEKILAYKRKWRTQNREREREQQLKYYWSDPEKFRAKSKKQAATYRKKNPEKVKKAIKKWQLENPEIVKGYYTKTTYRWHLEKKFGLTVETYDQIYKSQNGLCAICSRNIIKIGQKAPRKEVACVDHDHATGKIRELLCGNCNSALGLLSENISTLNNMIHYLTKHSKE